MGTIIDEFISTENAAVGIIVETNQPSNVTDPVLNFNIPSGAYKSSFMGFVVNVENAGTAIVVSGNISCNNIRSQNQLAVFVEPKLLAVNAYFNIGAAVGLAANIRQILGSARAGNTIFKTGFQIFCQMVCIKNGIPIRHFVGGKGSAASSNKAARIFRRRVFICHSCGISFNTFCINAHGIIKPNGNKGGLIFFCYGHFGCGDTACFVPIGKSFHQITVGLISGNCQSGVVIFYGGRSGVGTKGYCC